MLPLTSELLCVPSDAVGTANEHEKIAGDNVNNREM